jgi:Short C-terminal domain
VVTVVRMLREGYRDHGVSSGAPEPPLAVWVNVSAWRRSCAQSIGGRGSGSASPAYQLAKLADLRDRGVISAEEFERGKAKSWPEREGARQSAARHAVPGPLSAHRASPPVASCQITGKLPAPSSSARWSRRAPFTTRRPSRVRAGRGRWRTPVNAGQHCWKACKGQPFRSSNLLSSATADLRRRGQIMVGAALPSTACVSFSVSV